MGNWYYSRIRCNEKYTGIYVLKVSYAFSDIVPAFLKFLAILVVVSYKPVSYRKTCV